MVCLRINGYVIVDTCQTSTEKIDENTIDGYNSIKICVIHMSTLRMNTNKEQIVAEERDNAKLRIDLLILG